MKRSYKFVLSIAMLIATPCAASFAQDAPPTYQADPGVYKLLFEDQNFRVISGTWAPGATDKPHSHPVPSVAYALTDCTLQLTSADGKIVTITPKAGSVNAAPVTASHTGHNVGASECRTIFVERK
jgi:quercetin dioxygenase-like cupin family protein